MDESRKSEPQPELESECIDVWPATGVHLDPPTADCTCAPVSSPVAAEERCFGYPRCDKAQALPGIDTTDHEGPCRCRCGRVCTEPDVRCAWCGQHVAPEPVAAAPDETVERLRKSFQHVLFLGSRDADSSKWYAEELARIAVRDLVREAPRDLLARVVAEAKSEAWPCDDYEAPLTCYTVPNGPKHLICGGCRDAFPNGPEVQRLYREET